MGVLACLGEGVCEGGGAWGQLLTPPNHLAGQLELTSSLFIRFIKGLFHLKDKKREASELAFSTLLYHKNLL